MLRLLSFLLLLASLSHAKAGDLVVTGTGSASARTWMALEDIARNASTTYTATTSSGRNLVTTSTPVRVPAGGAVVDATYTRSITGRNVARAVWRAAGGVPGLVVTTAATAAWCKWQTDTWLCDERQPQVPGDSQTGPGFYAPQAPLFQSGFVRRPSNTGFTQLDACNAYRQQYTAQGAVLRNIADVPGSCKFDYQYPVGGVWNGTGNIPLAAGTVTVVAASQCPPAIDFGNPAYSVAGGPPDAEGYCPTGRYSRPSEDDFSDRMDRNNGPSVFPPILQDTAGRAPGPQPDNLAGPGGITGPSSAPKPGGTTTTRPTSNGGTETVTQQGTVSITYEGDSYSWTETNVTNVTNGAGTSTTTTTTPAPETLVCGVPGRPACKIDEAGTPSGYGALDGAKAAAGSGIGQIKDAITGAGTAHAPGSVPWSFGYSLPTGSCTAITATFPVINKTLTIDPCTSSVVALLRQLLGYLLAVLSALHIWQNVNRAVQAT